MTEESTSSSGWATFGKVSAVVALVCTVLGTAVAIYSFISGKPNVTAYVSSSQFRTPPDNSKEKEELKYSWERPVTYDGFFEITVENDGGAQADNVVLDFPYKGVAVIRSEDSESQPSQFEDRLALGTIRPTKRVYLYVWTTDKPASYKEDDFGITHAKGVGDIEFEIRAFGFWSAIYEGISGWFWFAFFMFGVVSWAIQSVERDNKLKKMEGQLEQLASKESEARGTQDEEQSKASEPDT